MKDIKLRIRSVESTMQITKAMQLVATSKVRRAKERMEKSQPYGDIARDAVMAAVAGCSDKNVPFVQVREAKKRCYVVIAGERGLAGGYNNNVFKAVAAHMEADGVPCCVLPLGRKAIEKYQRMGVELLSTDYAKVEGLSVGACRHMAERLIEGYLNGEFDEIILVGTTFETMLTQNVQVERLLPVPVDDVALMTQTVYELTAEETLQRIMPDYLTGRLYGALCDAFVSEVAARRTAMDSATKNADAMISDLTLRYNRARQGAITQEITEIVAGSEP